MNFTVSEKRWKIAQFFELKWWKNYVNKKNPQEYLSWKRTYWDTFVQNKLGTEETTTSTVIDIGCGPAGLFILDLFKTCTAIDPLLDSYEKELNIFSREMYPDVTFHNRSFESFTSSIQYDLIFCINAVNHFRDLKISFSKLNQLTQKDGVVLLSIDAHNYTVLKKIFQWIPGDILHPHQYNLKDYKTMICAAGFSIEEIFDEKSAFIFDYYVLKLRKS